MINLLTQYHIRKFRPSFNALMTKLFYASSNIKIGKNFKTDSIPKIWIDKGCRLEIGDNVEFRRSIEIRVHGKSKIRIGDNCRIDRGVRILSTNNAQISLGSGTRVGLYTVFNGGDSISIGSKCLISGFVYLQTSMHGFAEKARSVQDQGYQHAPIVLEDDCWLATHVVIMPGITLKQGAVVGSNAVVNKDVAAFQVVAGIPAKPIKERN